MEARARLNPKNGHELESVNKMLTGCTGLATRVPGRRRRVQGLLRPMYHASKETDGGEPFTAAPRYSPFAWAVNNSVSVFPPYVEQQREIPMLEQIKAAIRDRNLLRIDYHPGFRTVEPHTVGRGSDGHLLLRVFQRGGASASGENERWKLFRVDQMRSLVVLDEVFDGPHPGYRKGDKAMTGGIITEL